MYKDEVEASRKLLASRSGAPAVPSIAESGSGKEESVKDAAIIRMYEDMYDLCILEVRIKDGKFGPKDKEYVFSCVQTVDKKHSTSILLLLFCSTQHGWRRVRRRSRTGVPEVGMKADNNELTPRCRLQASPIHHHRPIPRRFESLKPLRQGIRLYAQFCRRSGCRTAQAARRLCAAVLGAHVAVGRDAREF
jgi:hypothetical protein